MTNKDIAAMLIKDMEDKKVFNAEWDGSCFNCGRPIIEGDDFVFMAGKKTCNTCKNEILEYLGTL